MQSSAALFPDPGHSRPSSVLEKLHTAESAAPRYCFHHNEPAECRAPTLRPAAAAPSSHMRARATASPTHALRPIPFKPVRNRHFVSKKNDNYHKKYIYCLILVQIHPASSAPGRACGRFPYAPAPFGNPRPPPGHFSPTNLIQFPPLPPNHPSASLSTGSGCITSLLTSPSPPFVLRTCSKPRSATKISKTTIWVTYFGQVPFKR